MVEREAVSFENKISGLGLCQGCAKKAVQARAPVFFFLNLHFYTATSKLTTKTRCPAGRGE